MWFTPISLVVLVVGAVVVCACVFLAYVVGWGGGKTEGEKKVANLERDLAAAKAEVDTYRRLHSSKRSELEVFKATVEDALSSFKKEVFGDEDEDEDEEEE